MLFGFKIKKLSMLNEEREFFQYKTGGLVYIISPLTTQLRKSPRKIPVKYVGSAAVYNITYPMLFLPCTLDGKLLLGHFEHERLKPTGRRTVQGNITTLPQLKNVLDAGITYN